MPGPKFGWGGRVFFDARGREVSEREIAADMEGFEADAEAVMAANAARRHKACAAVAQQLGVAVEDVPEDYVQIEYEWLRALEHVTGGAHYAALILPPELRPQRLSYWTDHIRGEEMRHFAVAYPGSGLVARGAGTGREELLALVALRTGATVEQLRALCWEELPADEPWMVDGHRKRWPAKYNDTRLERGMEPINGI